MLLREFTVDGHMISLDQDGAIYITKVINSVGEKVFYHEYKSYDKIKICFDEILHNIDKGDSDIQSILKVLEKSTM